MSLPVCLLWIALPAMTASAQSVTIRNNAGLEAAIRKAVPGTTILIAPGSYRGGIDLHRLKGRGGAPIVLAGADPARPPVFSGGGTEAFHLFDCEWVELRNLKVTGFPGNGINADDEETYETPSRHLRFERLVIESTGPEGNHDALKLSGVDSFTVTACTFRGWGGSAIDMVGCHDGMIDRCSFLGRPGFSQDSGVQIKGGSARILLRRSFFQNAGVRAVNLGGSTDLEYFRPRNASSEASAIEVVGNRFVGSETPVAWVTADGGRFHHNTIVFPGKWVMRILQETDDPRFVKCRGGVFENNLVVFDSRVAAFVNNGPGTRPRSFAFRGNAWFQTDGTRRPELPSRETNGIYGVDPALSSYDSPDMRITSADPRLRSVGADHAP